MPTAPPPAKPLVAVFAKPPLPGAVKTRLIPDLGAAGAAALAAAFLVDVLAVVRRLDWPHLVVATTGHFDEADESLARALHGVPRWDQGAGDLGARLETILRRGLAAGAPAAIAVGADLPGLGERHLDAARAALHHHQAVLGPTADGGYYLIGLRRCPAGLLAQLPWSSTETCEASRRRLREQQLEPAIIEPFFDVDEPADLTRLVRQLRAQELHAPATAAVLRQLGCL